VAATQIPQLAMKVIEDDTSLVDLHPDFDECYHDHEYFCHLSEVTSFQPNALD
jgi:hypothetical protein